MNQDKTSYVKDQETVVPMNRAQRRKLQKNSKHVTIPTPTTELLPVGEEFIKFAEEQSVNLNAFFKMFAYWLSMPSSQKEAVIVECVRQGKIDLEDDKNAEQDSESK